MARVHLLDDELINKIAAGEVVERPASVVKELVENAIDAGAQHIRVGLKDGGRQSIEVSDDGQGLSHEDAVLAIKRHTTSKLRSADDLFAVSTMGFRGEALASISSVSRFTLQSMSREHAEGTRVHHEDGKTTDSPWQGPFGTSVTVKDLFYNVPARKTFMKTSAAEFAVCHEYIQALALALPERGFRLLHNDKEMFSVSPLPVAEGWARGEKALRMRAQAILGEEITSKLIYVQHVDRHAKVEGLISPPGLDKASAKHIYTFVNHRWVKDKVLRNGVLRGYHSHILRGKFPIALMYLDVEASLVDVNVHPAKTELRFQYGSEVAGAVAMAIRDGLRQGAWSSSAPNPSAAMSTSYAPKKAEPQPPIDFDLLLKRESESRALDLDDRSTGIKRTTYVFDNPSAAKPSRPAQESIGQQPSPLPSSSKSPSGSSVLASSAATRVAAAKMPYEPIAPPRISQPTHHRGEPSPAPGLLNNYASKIPSEKDVSDPKSARSFPYEARDSHSRDLKERAGATAGADPIRASDASASAAPRTDHSHNKDFAGSLKGPAHADADNLRNAPSDLNHSSVSGSKTSFAMNTSRSGLDLNGARAPEGSDAGLLNSTSKYPVKPITVQPVKPIPREDIHWDELTYIGAFQKCFLFFEHKDQMLVVDQHAFHERILYERLLKNPDLLKRSQPLLMPEVLGFSASETADLGEKRSTYKNLGFDFEEISPTEIEVRAIPSLLVNKDLQGVFQSLTQGSKDHQEILHDVLASVACHAAVRAGEDLPAPELKQLLAEAKTVDFFLNCPHGRRVLRWFKANQVAAWFDRLG